MTELTEKEQKVFEVITNASNLCLVRGIYEGNPVAVVALLDDFRPDTQVVIHPIAILLDDGMKAKLEPTEDYEKRA